MLLSCPNCGTEFSVPDHALGAKGRTLKCAKCGHKWFQVAQRAGMGEFGLDESSFPPPPRRPPPMPEPEPYYQPEPEPYRPPGPNPNSAAQAAARAAAAFDFDVDLDDRPPIGPSPARPQSEDFDADQMPEVLTREEDPKRGGAGFLWVLLLLLLIACAGGGIYFNQDRLIPLWPPLEGILVQAGLRHEKPGAGLDLRHAGTPERLVVNDVEVLIIRGVIANVSDRVRTIPPMKLVLNDKDRHPLQEKVEQPPVTSLDPGATASFRIQLQRPDPNATDLVIVFIEPAEPVAMPPVVK